MAEVLGSNLLLKLFKQSGADVEIAIGEGCSVYSKTANKFINSFDKLTYALWLVRQPGEIVPDEVTEQSGEIRLNKLSLSFKDANLTIMAYEIFIGRGDSTAPGPLRFKQTHDDVNGRTQTFEFSVQPSQKDCRVLYLANRGVNTKFIPAVNRCGHLVPDEEGNFVKAKNDWEIKGPSNVSVSILPIAEISEQYGDLMQNVRNVLKASLN